MPNVESKPIATSIRVDQEHTLEMRADMATKTAEVENVATGEMYTSGGVDSDFSVAEVKVEGDAELDSVLAMVVNSPESPENYPISGNWIGLTVPEEDPIINEILMYRGLAIMMLAFTSDYYDNLIIETSENITYEKDDQSNSVYFTIIGNGTITLTSSVL